jgi:hypothetical protein
MKLKMVNGRTYVCAAIFGGERIVTRGEVVNVTEEQAETLLKESYFDALNNEHNYFEVVDGSSADKAGARKGVRRQRAEA